MSTSPSELAAALPDGAAVALSGGVDSVCLLDAAVAAGRDVVAIHVDHQLRPDSAADADFCRAFAESLGVPFETVVLEVPRGNSTQGRARTQRYAALVRAASRLGASAIATAHHAGDVAETAIMQAERGSGPAGIAGPRSRGEWLGFPLVRPFLSATREEILSWARTRGLAWREDPTNRDVRYARSRVRSRLADGSVVAPDRAATTDEAFALEQSVAGLRADAARVSRPRLRTLARDALRGGPDRAARLLLDTARELGGELPRVAVDALVSAIDDHQTESRRFCGRRVVAEVARDEVVLEATRGQGTKLFDRRHAVGVRWTPGESALRWFEHEIRENSEGIWLPRGVELTIRGHRPGERIRTIDGGGSKKIADLLAEHGVPVSRRWRWPCAFLGDRCIWVVGLGTDVDLAKDFSSKSPKSGILMASCAFPVPASQGGDAREPSD